jgi:hypothetical protein
MWTIITHYFTHSFSEAINGYNILFESAADRAAGVHMFIVCFTVSTALKFLVNNCKIAPRNYAGSETVVVILL